MSNKEKQTTKNSSGFVKLQRSDKTEELLKDMNAFALATVIALRARRRNIFSIHNLKVGEALLGDYKNYGMTEREYRTAKLKLSTWGIASFRATNKGTIAKLADNSIYDINQELSDEQATGSFGQNNTKRQKNDEPDDRQKINTSPANKEPYNSQQGQSDEQSANKRRTSDEQATTNKEGKESKEKKKSHLLQIFNHWNRYKGGSVCKHDEKITWHSHTLRSDGSISPEIKKAIARALNDGYLPEQICTAIDNYNKVLLGKDCFWSYVWPLSTFLTVKYERNKNAERKWWQFLPDNFIEENYLTETAKKKRANQQAGPSVYELVKAGRTKEKEVANAETA